MNLDEITSHLLETLKAMPEEERIKALNQVRFALHEVSPFSSEPVDCVLWVKSETVVGNAYNPNTVAPVEMQLLVHSILNDGFTQPIVTYPTKGTNEVVDGFHRHRVGKEDGGVRERVKGYLPIVRIRPDRGGKGDRIAATIRHNRARGKHLVGAMSDIVVELVRRNWSDEKIARELGMDADEVLRLKQVSGLSEMFVDKAFSQAWEPVPFEEDVTPET
jgi:ParB-like chromosome segregation protein Spo0J